MITVLLDGRGTFTLPADSAAPKTAGSPAPESSIRGPGDLGAFLYEF